jgi:hypothetical protein
MAAEGRMSEHDLRDLMIDVDSVYYDRGDSGKYDRIGVWGVE